MASSSQSSSEKDMGIIERAKQVKMALFSQLLSEEDLDIISKAKQIHVSKSSSAKESDIIERTTPVHFPIEKGSDMDITTSYSVWSGSDFLCSSCTCEQLVKYAGFYCKTCRQYFCRKCLGEHHQLFKKHTILGKDMYEKGEFSKKIDMVLQKCQMHQNEILDFFCNDHNQLCCAECVFVHHSHCPISKLDKEQTLEDDSSQDSTVKKPTDFACSIRGIVVLPHGQILLVDSDNKCVKLLDMQKEVVSLVCFFDFPQDMCQITSNEVAVTVGKEVHFISVNQRKLVEGRKLQLQHRCAGIAHHQGNLFITSLTALYVYSLHGKPLLKLFEDTSGDWTVWKCAVSPRGDKLYITNYYQHILLTLARDGTVLAKFTDYELQFPEGVHVTPEGHVLVCGYGSSTVIKVDCDGRSKLATLATREDGVIWPNSVVYNHSTSSLIVGQTGALLELNIQAGPSVHIASTDGDLRRLFGILNIDAMAECGMNLFPAFRHGLAAVQGIVTRGRNIFDKPVFDATESQMVYPSFINIYSTFDLMREIKSSNPKHLAHEKNILIPAIVAVKKEQHLKIEQWIRSINKDVTGLCFLLIGKDEKTTYVVPKHKIYLGLTTTSEIIVAADDLLERAIFGVLGNLVKKCIEKYGASTNMSDIEEERTLQSIYSYVRTVYNKSEVPELERVCIPEMTYRYPENIDDVIKRLLKVEGVIGCSKNIGHLEVLVDNTKDTDATSRRINQILENEKIKPMLLYCKFTSFISPGDKTYNTAILGGRFATLGGFARRFPKLISSSHINISEAGDTHFNPEHSTEKLVALISRHFVHALGKSNCVYVSNTILGKVDKIHDRALVDIIPIDVPEECIKQCDTRFQTESGQHMFGKLCDNKEQACEGESVYIWGAVTSPGLGTIAAIDLHTPNGLLITIHDRIEGQSFCKQGDSGAMVCATDRRDRKLFAVAMIVGILERQSGESIYVAVKLKEAFEELEEYYLSEFKLCNGLPL